ncbi:MAG TPA: TlpA disulfide reductase family protein [Candidatus Binataceae bacterium]|nr:TlpA disulfide reductase family protein [Candidatus Binataceae bacterium]
MTQSNRRRFARGALSIALAAAIIIIAQARASAGGPDGAPLDFQLRTLGGASMKLSQFRGHPVIVDFWATWCGPCRREIPELKNIYSRYHQSRGLEVLGIACDTVQGDGIRAVAPFVAEFKINYTILVANDAVIAALGVDAIPTTLFIGPDGRVVARVMGAGHSGELTEGARALMDGAKRGHSGAPRGAKADPNAVDL